MQQNLSGALHSSLFKKKNPFLAVATSNFCVVGGEKMKEENVVFLN
jgi:hypothetical protein